MNCPNCGESCWRDEVDIGVGIQYGPWRCSRCSWYETAEVDQLIDVELDFEREKESGHE